MSQTLSEIKTIMAAFGLRPKHRLGQNFLHDGNQMARVIEAAAIETGDLVLEVGAGTGALSQRLLDAGARLVAVEIDQDLQPILQQQLSRYGPQVKVVMADALASKHEVNPSLGHALQSLAIEGTQGPNRPSQYKLVANLPYQVASPLLANLLTQSIENLWMSEAVVMIQREVADRLRAPCGHKTYGALSVLVQALARVERIATIKPSCFWPIPKVDSAIIRLQRHPKPLTSSPEKLRRTLVVLFGQRRKQLGTILGRDCRLPEGIDACARPEQLSVNQMVLLSEWMDEEGKKKAEGTEGTEGTEARRHEGT